MGLFSPRMMPFQKQIAEAAGLKFFSEAEFGNCIAQMQVEDIFTADQAGWAMRQKDAAPPGEATTIQAIAGCIRNYRGKVPGVTGNVSAGLFWSINRATRLEKALSVALHELTHNDLPADLSVALHAALSNTECQNTRALLIRRDAEHDQAFRDMATRRKAQAEARKAANSAA